MTGVLVGDGVTVTGCGGTLVFVWVGLATNIGVLVAGAISVGMGVLVGGMLTAVLVAVGMGVRVAKDAPGVRKTFCQIGLVRMAGSRGSRKLMGRLVRKSLLGLRFRPHIGVQPPAWREAERPSAGENDADESQ